MKGLQRAPAVLVGVRTVNVQRSETLTVWLGSFNDPGGRTQVELRVLPDGQREVFVSDGADVLDMDEWYSPESLEAGPMKGLHVQSIPLAVRQPPRRVTRAYLSRLMDECQQRWKVATTSDDDESMQSYVAARERLETEITRLVREKQAEATLHERTRWTRARWTGEGPL